MGYGATLSIMGLYTADNTIFDYMVFPTEFNDAEKENTIQSILFDLCNLEILYPNPNVMKNLIGVWSKKELPVWQRIHTASLIEYNPLENYNRTEKETVEDDHSDTHSGTDTTTGNSNSTDTHSGTDSTTGTSNSTDTNSGTDTNTGYIAAYDSPESTPVKRSVDEFEHGHVLENYSNNGSTMTHGHVITNYSNNGSSLVHGEKIVHDGDSERNLHAFGNIGVTTSQEMLTQEVNVAKIINVKQIIVDSFKDRFCLVIY